MNVLVLYFPKDGNTLDNGAKLGRRVATLTGQLAG